MLKYVGTFLLAVLSFLSLSAQQQPAPWCGTMHTAEDVDAATERVRAHKALIAAGVVHTRDLEYVPVTFHLVARNDGTGRISEAKVLNQLCALNEDFAPHGIQFYLKDGTFNYVNNTAVYDNHQATLNSVMALQKDNRSINIWIPNSADIDPNDEGVTLGYYDFSRDWLVVSRNEIGGPNTTLTHEMGHFFSLLHPFNGWDGVYYQEEDVPAPATAPLGSIPTELADGSNCETAGDMLCDTPAEYGNGFGWQGCEFTLNVLDPAGQPIDPDELNWMTYFLQCPVEDYYFSPEQEELMTMDLASNDRNYLRQLPAPFTEPIEGTTTLLSPIGNETVSGYNEVLLEWTAVPNAHAYLLETSRTANFTVSPYRQVVYGTSVVLNNLDANRTYFWRVRPFNMYSTCAEDSQVESFKTDNLVATAEPVSVLDWRIAPNPVRSGQALNLSLTTAENLEATIDLTDLNGRRVLPSRRHVFIAGENQLSLPVQALPSGVYFLRIQTAVGQLTDKLLIAR